MFDDVLHGGETLRNVGKPCCAPSHLCMVMLHDLVSLAAPRHNSFVLERRIKVDLLREVIEFVVDAVVLVIFKDGRVCTRQSIVVI